jgi:hypothetical protein
MSRQELDDELAGGLAAPIDIPARRHGAGENGAQDDEVTGSDGHAGAL